MCFGRSSSGGSASSGRSDRLIARCFLPGLLCCEQFGLELTLFGLYLGFSLCGRQLQKFPRVLRTAFPLALGTSPYRLAQQKLDVILG